MTRFHRVIVLVMLIVLAVTLAGAFMTRGLIAYLPFLQARKGNWTGLELHQLLKSISSEVKTLRNSFASLLSPEGLAFWFFLRNELKQRSSRMVTILY